MTGRVIEERTYFPDGMDPDDINASVWNIKVAWRGNGKWAVLSRGSQHEQLSATGKWLYCPLKMTEMRWCRFDFETACALAEQHIEEYRVNGMTWADWLRRDAEVHP